MEFHFELSKTPPELWIKGILAHFDSAHFDEVRVHRKLPYSRFKKEIISMFKKPDLTHAKVQELMSLTQFEDETVEAFMNRIKELSTDAFRSLPDRELQVMEVTTFCQGLADKNAARFVAVEAKGNSAAAIRIASAAVSVKNREKPFSKNKGKKPNQFFLAPNENSEDCEDDSDLENNDDSE